MSLADREKSCYVVKSCTAFFLPASPASHPTRGQSSKVDTK